ncbi:glycosyl hydrolase [Bacteroidia bacterium]|nr:glycosyl hydrolase [Bacteroidia bacterium]
MKTTIFTLLLAICCAVNLQAQKDNVLSKQEQKNGWTLLFDGKSFDGWRKCNSDQMASNWKIDQNAMKVERGEKAGSGQGGDILFGKKQYRNFELSIDWKIEKSGNSGIFYYVVEYPGKPIYYAAPEIQVLDNWYASDNKLTNHLAGSLYDMIPALPQNAKPAGEWNTIVIRVENGKAIHTQNGVKVVEYEIWTPEWKELVAKSKFKDWPGFKDGPAKEGYIGLQDHGYDCWFKNIKIREL